MENKDNLKIGSEMEGAITKADWNNERFLKIFYSEKSFNKIASSNSNCGSPIKETDYNINLFRTKEYVFENEASNLINYYKNTTLPFRQRSKFGEIL